LAESGDRGRSLMMKSLPRILLIVPGLLIGLLVPAVIAAPKTAPTGAIGMIGDDFAQSAVTIHRGQRLTLVNDSHFVHVIGPGRNTHIISPERGVPMTGFHLMQTNDVFTTGRWMTTGTFYLTCSVHPGMTLKVVVIR
jgi:plastocyanin